MTVEEVLTLPEVKELVSGPDSAIVNVSDIYKHVLTHRDILARFVYVQVSDCQLSGQNFFKVNKQEISNFAFPVLITNYLRKSGFLTDGR
jgi:A/G-specific adenine glycosylase